jgi:PAS domain S-box-containing protein
LTGVVKASSSHKGIPAADMFRLAVEACPHGMVIIDRDGRMAMANVAVERQFGYRQEELIGQSVDMLVPLRLRSQDTGDRGAFKRPAERHHIGAAVDLFGLRKDGSEFSIEIVLTPIRARKAFVLGVIVDLSERKRIERLKDEFVSTVSHELRTPLTSISGSLGLLMGQWAGKLPESAARLLSIAHKNSQRLVRLINDILDIEKIESGHVVFNLSQIGLRQLVEQAIEGNRGFAEGYGVRVRLDAASKGGEVNVDPDRLSQVITNLLSNAIKFSAPDQEVLVAVEKNGNIFRVSVRDHGVGIPAAFKPHIFEKFAQADATDSRQKGGTGLGLNIAKQIVERLGGTIGFADAPGGGTNFHIELPASDGADAADIDLEAGHSTVRILLCEDDREAAAALRERLRPAGFTVDLAYTAAAAVARADTTSYAAVLVNLRLPDGDGISLILRMRALANYRDTPIIVISRDAARGRSDVRSSRLNVLDWLSVPVEFERLVQILKASTAPQSHQRARILHLDDDYDVLAVVTDALHTMADVISVDSIESARHALMTERIDLAVLDISLGTSSGLDLLPNLRDRLGNVIPVIIFSAHGAGLACDEQVQVALSKSHTSIDNLVAAVRDRLALLPARAFREMA